MKSPPDLLQKSIILECSVAANQLASAMLISWFSPPPPGPVTIVWGPFSFLLLCFHSCILNDLLVVVGFLQGSAPQWTQAAILYEKNDCMKILNRKLIPKHGLNSRLGADICNFLLSECSKFGNFFWCSRWNNNVVMVIICLHQTDYIVLQMLI